MLNFIQTNFLKTKTDLNNLNNNKNEDWIDQNNSKNSLNLIEIEVICLLKLFVATYTFNKNLSLNDLNVSFFLNYFFK